MAKMNISYPNPRGCWIDKEMNSKKEVVKATVYDYPTWRLNNGDYVSGASEQAIPDGQPAKMEFNDLNEAIAFCKEEKYVICDRPKTKEEREAALAKYGNAMTEDDFEDDSQKW